MRELLEKVKQNKIVMYGTIAIVVLLIIALIALLIPNNKNEKVGDLDVSFKGGNNITVEKVKDGFVKTKDFTVTNKSDKDAKYKLEWTKVSNSFVTQSDLLYSIHGKGDSAGELGTSQIPVASAPIFMVVVIPANTTHTYTFKAWYKQSKNSNGEKNSKFTGDLNIKFLK